MRGEGMKTGEQNILSRSFAVREARNGAWMLEAEHEAQAGVCLVFKTGDTGACL